MAVKAVDGFLIVTADQRAENGHVFFNGDDIALFKIGFIPLVVEMENHGNDLQRLVEERVVGGGEDQPVEIAIQLGKQAIVVADVFPQLAVTAQQLFGLQPAFVVHRQIDKVGKGVRFQHLAQLKQLFGVALIKFLHAPLTAPDAVDQVVTAEVQQKLPHHHRAHVDRTRQLQFAEGIAGAQLLLVDHLVERLFKLFPLFIKRKALAVEAILRQCPA
ncbi:hypothetical protein D3C72_883270 [compost metagenome]